MSDRDVSQDDVRDPSGAARGRLFFRPLPPALPAAALLRDRRLSLGLRSAAGILFAIAFLWPTLTEHMLVPLFAAYAFTDGALALAPGGWSLTHRTAWPLLIGGCINILAAFIVYGWPALWSPMTLPVLANATAIWAISIGVTCTLTCLSLRQADREHLFLLSGIAALGFGRALLSHLASDAIVLSTWMGLYMLTVGVVFLKLTLQNSRPLLEP